MPTKQAVIGPDALARVASELRFIGTAGLLPNTLEALVADWRSDQQRYQALTGRLADFQYASRDTSDSACCPVCGGYARPNNEFHEPAGHYPECWIATVVPGAVMRP